MVARQQITERIPDANLPNGISPDLGPLATLPTASIPGRDTAA